jgi:midasin (ATPase involved in ribosome maturation)
MADTDDEIAAQDAEDEQQQVDEELELDALEERELLDTRRRLERDTDADLADAMRRADVAEQNHGYLRAKAADERLLAGADAADSRYRAAADDDRRAHWNYAEGRAQRSRAEQPPAAEAVRNAPDEPPVARKNVKRPRGQQKKSKALREFGLGD